MKTNITLTGLLLQLCHQAFAAGKGATHSDMDLMATVVGVLLMLLILLTVWKMIQKKEVVQPKPKTFEELVTEEFEGKLSQIGPNALANTKFIGNHQGNDTYLTLTKIDRAGIKAATRQEVIGKVKPLLLMALIGIALFSIVILF